MSFVSMNYHQHITGQPLTPLRLDADGLGNRQVVNIPLKMRKKRLFY